MLFEIEGLKKVYGNRTVLDVEELVLEKGLVYALLGPNGSGKTTFLEIVSFLIPATAGRIVYDGTRVEFTRNSLTALRREIILVQQNPVLFTTTVYKNLEFGLRVRKIPQKERERLIEESLERVGMGAFARAQARGLSGGETQRVAIAMALACSPNVLFLDEPIANVDLENQLVIEKIIREINEENKISVVFTSHAQASHLADRTIYLYEGKAVGYPVENLFSGKVMRDEDGGTTCVIQDRIRLRVDSDRTGTVRLSIDPLQVKVFPPHEKAPGRMHGRITRLSQEGSLIRALVDVGIPLNALLAMEDARKHHVRIGAEVAISLEPGAVHVL